MGVRQEGERMSPGETTCWKADVVISCRQELVESKVIEIAYKYYRKSTDSDLSGFGTWINLNFRYKPYINSINEFYKRPLRTGENT